MPVVVVATIRPKPGKLDEVAAAFADTIPAVHDESGCELYALHRAEDHLVMIEKWADAAALDAHSRGEALRELGGRLRGLVEGPSEVVVLDAIPAGDKHKGAL